LKHKKLKKCILHATFLEKLLEYVLYQNEGINQERGKHGTKNLGIYQKTGISAILE
jgi:hypothetical protein